MKKQLKQYLYIAAVLCVSASCKSGDLCQCLDCGVPDQKMTCKKTVKNARADIGFGGFIIENVDGEPQFVFNNALWELL